MSPAAVKSPRLKELLHQRRTPDAQRRHVRLAWIDALTSLWSPVTALAVALIPYLFVVELSPPSAGWAQPLMKAFGVLMVLTVAGLAAARQIVPTFRKRREARHDSHELVSELGGSLRRSRPLEPAALEKMVAQASTLESKRLAGDVDGMRAESKRLTELAERDLSQFRKTQTVDLVVGLAKALLVALLIRTVLIEPYRIPSGSMIPTLEIGDQIFVNKFIYGIRVPFINFVPFVIVRPPERGDVIVFNNPVDTSEDFIKRVVGIPGDRIEVRNSVVIVNGIPQARELVSGDYTFWDLPDRGDWYRATDWHPRQGQLWSENLDHHLHSVIRLEQSSPPGLVEGPFLVPPEHVFVMGDNRNNSADSRYGLGSPAGGVAYVPYGNIKGKAMIIWLSLSHGGLMSNLTGAVGLRTDRFFQPVR